MTPQNTLPESALDPALAALEEVLETPAMPGEIVDWCNQVQEVFEHVHALYTQRIRPSHERQLIEIRDQDQELSSVAAKLAEQDDAILTELQRLRALLSRFVQNVDQKAEGSDESAAEAERETLVRATLALVIRIRTLEKSLQAWFVEAFQRDRGIAD